ncbi:hypothetical protein WDW89_13795 [Deltaproteobacteria bacterium TL4]
MSTERGIFSNHSPIQKVLTTVENHLPGVSKILNEYGHLTLGEYIQTFSHNTALPVQPRDDLIRVACVYAKRLLGEQTSDALKKRLETTPSILTANHHGPNFLSLFVQSDLIYSLAEVSNAGYSTLQNRVIPVFAYGSISLNNPSYPKGIILSRKKENKDLADTFGSSLKINVYPDKNKHTLVCTAAPFDRDMVQHALSRVKYLSRQQDISAQEAHVLNHILNEEYLSNDVLTQDSYSDQSVILNHRLWKRLFSNPVRALMPEMVYLEMEKIVGMLLEEDLRNQDSLAYRIFFDPDLRTQLLDIVDQKEGLCWNISKLKALLNSALSEKERQALLEKSGTVFFWGIDAKGRRIHLVLVKEQGDLFLKGMDDSRHEFKFPFTPEKLIEGLRNKKIIPGLFTTFMVVAFARAYRCFGGFWQITYLPLMQSGLVAALQATKGYAAWAEQIATVPTANYVTGKSVAVACYSNGSIRPAGLIELSLKDGLKQQDLDKISSLTVKEANLYGMLEIYDSFIKKDEKEQKLLNSLALGISEYLGDKLIQVQV